SLITGAKGQEWKKIAESVGNKFGLGLQCHLIGGEIVDVEGTFKDRFGITDNGAVLVRPDGFIAWRAAEMRPCAIEDLRNALTSIITPSAGAGEQHVAASSAY